MFNLNNILLKEKCQLIYRQKDKNVKNETSALHHPLDPAGTGGSGGWYGACDDGNRAAKQKSARQEPKSSCLALCVPLWTFPRAGHGVDQGINPMAMLHVVDMGARLLQVSRAGLWFLL